MSADLIAQRLASVLKSKSQQAPAQPQPQPTAAPVPAAPPQAEFISQQDAEAMLRAFNEGDATVLHKALNLIGTNAYTLAKADSDVAVKKALQEQQSESQLNNSMSTQTQQLIQALVKDTGLEDTDNQISSLAEAFLLQELSQPDFDLEKAVQNTQNKLSRYVPKVDESQLPSSTADIDELFPTVTDEVWAQSQTTMQSQSNAEPDQS